MKITATRVDLCIITTTSLTDVIIVVFVFEVNIHMVLLYLLTMAAKLPFVFCLPWLLWLTKLQMLLWSPSILWLPQLLLLIDGCG